MNRIIFLSFAFSLIIFLAGCKKDYLNVVPDNIVTVDRMFENKDKTLQALATCYSFLNHGNFQDHYNTSLMLGNEYVTAAVYNSFTSVFHSNRIMMGDQNPENPYFSTWNNTYIGIRYCNIFLNNANKVPDFEPGDFEDYVSQVKFIKAYLHFQLLNKYGPIVIADKEVNMNAPDEEAQQFRKPVDECFKYIIDLIDEAMPGLKPLRKKDEKGQIDQVIAKSIKGKILLYWASPLFNGNREYYGGFVDKKTGQPFFNPSFDKERWKNAADALKEAIDFAEINGISLYKYQKNVYDYDRELILTSGILKNVYDLKFSIVDPWNSELIWGESNLDPAAPRTMQSATQVMNLEFPNRWNMSYNYISASQFIVDQFYTKNGVPISQDRTFDYEGRQSIVRVPTDGYHKGFFIPDDQEVTAKEYLNREPRFYAWIANDRSLWRTYGTIYQMRLRFNELAGGGNAALNGEHYQTGIAIKKWVHPETQNIAWQRAVIYPYPIMRLADLYLLYAEAMNEYYGPSAEVFKYLDLVRERAGLPKLEEVWNDGSIVRMPGTHMQQSGLREIIKQERFIELSFEGHQYWDVRRWKLGSAYYNLPIMGWDSFKDNAQDFYVQIPAQSRKWVTPRDYLTPISIATLNRNPNLVQNPGW